MADFTPLPAKAAGIRAMAKFKAGEIKFDDKGSADIVEGDFTVRMAVAPGCSGPTLRVIDASGRHWFPDIEGLA